MSAIKGVPILATPLTVRGIESEFGGVGPSPFCPLLSLVATREQDATCTIMGNQVDFVATGTPQAFCVVEQNAFQIGGDTWTEQTVTAVANSPVVGMGVNINFGSPGPTNADGIVVVMNPGGTSTAFLISDFGGTPLWSNTSIDSLPYVIHQEINNTTGEITYSDNKGNSGSIGTFPGIINQDINMAMIGFGSTATETASFQINSGYSNPVITPSPGYEAYCANAPAPRVQLCGTLVGLEDFFGNPNTNVMIVEGTGDADDSRFIQNLTADPQTVALATNTTWDFPSQPSFVELALNSLGASSDDNFISAIWGAFLGAIGAGIGVFPKQETGNDGALVFLNQFQQIIQGFAEQIIIEKPGVGPYDTWTITHVSGGGGDLISIGFELNTQVGGQLQSLSRIPIFDFSADNLVFDIQYGANPVVQVTISSANPTAAALVLDIQTQIQAAGGVYADVTATKENGINITPGYKISVGYDAALSEMDLADSLGNTINLNLNNFLDPSIVALLQAASLDYFSIVSVAGNSTIDSSFNAGKYVPVNALPAKYKGHCDVPPGQKLYQWGTTFAVDGNVTQENSGRTQVLTNDIAETENPAAVAVFSDFIFSSTSFTTNCFEAEITFLQPDVLREQWQVGLNALLTTDLRMTREGTGEGLTLQSEFPNNNPISLANELPAFAVGDVMTACVFDNGDFPVTPSIQFVIEIGGTLVIYDKLKMAAPDSGEPPYTAFSELNNPFAGNPGNMPDGNQAKITFNGIDGDYAVTDYPPDFLNYTGDPMPLSIDGAYQRNAAFTPWNWTSNADRTINYSNPVGGVFKTFQAVNGVTSPIEARAHLPLFMNYVSGQAVVVGFRVDTANGDFKLEANGVQYSNTKTIVRQNGPDVVYEITTDGGGGGNGNVRAGYTLQDGDLIYLQFRQGPIIEPVVQGWVDIFLYDVNAAQMTKIIALGYTDTTITGDPDQRNWQFAFLAGFQNLPVSTTAQVTSQCKSADMDAVMTSLPDIQAGAVDLEGTLV